MPAFAPPPEVFSTVIRLTMHPRFEELAVDAAGFLRFLRQIFALKRKTLGNNLRASGYEAAVVEQAFNRCGVDAQVRVSYHAHGTDLELFLDLFGQGG